MDSQVESLKGGVVPVGLPKVKYSREHELLDTPCTVTPLQIQIDLTSGSMADGGPEVTFRQAMENLHIQTLAISKRIEREFEEVLRQKLQQKTKRSSFIETCTAEANRFVDKIADLDL